MSKKKRGKTKALGCVIVDYDELARVCEEQGTWVEIVLKKASVCRRTVDRIRAGRPIRPSSIEPLQNLIGPENLGRIARRTESIPLAAATEPEKAVIGKPLGEWIVDQVLTKWITTTNGLQFRVVKLRHEEMPNIWARGKCYELGHLSDDDRFRLREHLQRHPIICRKLVPHPRFPVNERAFSDRSGNQWWVVEQWIPGITLEEIMATGHFPRTDLLRVAREIAEGLQILHRHDIIRRELSPRFILLREADRSVVLTEFELGKLLKESPTVSGNWPDDPYRAAEVGAGPIDVRADVYSWGRIVMHLMLGELLPAGKEASRLSRCDELQAVKEIVLRSLALPRSDRPNSIDDVIRVLDSVQRA